MSGSGGGATQARGRAPRGGGATQPRRRAGARAAAPRVVRAPRATRP